MITRELQDDAQPFIFYIIYCVLRITHINQCAKHLKTTSKSNLLFSLHFVLRKVETISLSTEAEYLSFAVEAQDLETDTGRASSLDLMQMSEQIKACSASAIVQLALRQDT